MDQPFTPVPFDEEKKPNHYESEAKTEAGIIALPAVEQGEIVEKDVSPSDGDDALRMVGTHAHQFDDKYYKRLTRKIVCHPKYS